MPEIREVDREDVTELIPVLMLAEVTERALQWSLDNLSDTIYRMDGDEGLLAVATLRWSSEPCEIVEFAVVEAMHGRGLGRQFLAWLCEEARRRRKLQLFVGTGNASIGNIAFYQKCGFRMHSVRQDYFRYHKTPEYENGIRVRDMLLFRYDLLASEL